MALPERFGDERDAIVPGLALLRCEHAAKNGMNVEDSKEISRRESDDVLFGRISNLRGGDVFPPGVVDGDISKGVVL